MRRALLLAGAALAAACGGGGDPAGDVLGPSAVTVQDVQTRIFTPRCALPGCHAGPGSPFDLDLATAALSSAGTVGVPSAEVPARMRVAPGNPAESYLWLKVTGDPSILGDRMPASGSPLNAGELDLLRTWIEQGAR